MIKDVIIMFCPYCGTKIGDTSRFCGFCGKEIGSSASPVNQPEGITAAEPAPVSPVNPAAPESSPIPPVSTAAPESSPISPVNSVNATASEAAPFQAVPESKVQFTVPADVSASIVNDSPESFKAEGVLPPNQEIFSGDGTYSSPVQSVSASQLTGDIPQQAAPNDFVPPAMQPQDLQPEMPSGVPVQPELSAPVQPEYAPAAVDARPVRKPAKKLNMAVTIVISILFGIMSFAFVTTAFTVGSVKQGLAENALSDGIEDIDLEDIVVGDLLCSPKFENFVRANNIVLPEKKAEKAELAEVIALSVRVNSKNLTSDQVEEIISRLRISEELSVIVKAYEDYLITGKPGDELSDGIGEEIKRIVKNGEKTVSEITEMRLADNYEEKLDDIINDNQDLLDSILPENSLKSASGVINIVCNPIVLIASLVLSVVMIALIWVISKRVAAALMTGGIVFTLIGCVFVAASIVIQDLTMISVLNYSCVEDVLSPLLYNAFGSNLLYSGLICVGTGVVLIAAFVITKIAGKSHRNKVSNQQA